MDAAALIKNIEYAFNSAVYPGDDNLVADNSGDELESMQIKAAFLGKRWRDIPADTMRESKAALSFFSAAGYRYYLPAFMCFSLGPDEYAAEFGVEVVYSLTPDWEGSRIALEALRQIPASVLNVDPAALEQMTGGWEAELGDGAMEKRFLGRMNGFAESQRTAIIHYLEFADSEWDAWFSRQEPRIALDTFWRPHAKGS